MLFEEENVHAMHLVLRDGYTVYNQEIVAIFKGSSKPFTHYFIADKSFKIAQSGGNKVPVRQYVDDFVREAIYACNENLLVTTFHNHSTGTAFGLEDIQTLIFFKCMKQAFVDSDKIRSLEKSGDFYRLYEDSELIEKAICLLNNIWHKYAIKQHKDLARQLTKYLAAREVSEAARVEAQKEWHDYISLMYVVILRDFSEEFEAQTGIRISFIYDMLEKFTAAKSN